MLGEEPVREVAVEDHGQSTATAWQVAGLKPAEHFSGGPFLLGPLGTPEVRPRWCPHGIFSHDVGRSHARSGLERKKSHELRRKMQRDA